jgi:hypothetical protein
VPFRHFRLIILVALACFAGTLPLCASGGDNDKVARLDVIVVRAYNGKPVRNASVVLHPVSKNGKQEKGGMELKTDPEGKASLDIVPYGKLRIQAIAPGLQTYGDDVEINQPQQQITIKMNRPQDQYTIYK